MATRNQSSLSNTHDGVLLAILMLMAAWTFLQYDLVRQPIPEDTTYHIYAAQQMLEGHPIYRDVAIIKTPLADFFTAFALPPGRLAGLADTMASRLIFLLVGIGTVGVTYLAGRVLFGSRLIGVVAALIVAGNDFYGMRMVTGPEPKSLLILFALGALVLIAKRRWVGAGICAALAALAWQPALMVMAIALGAALISPWYENKVPDWKSRRRWEPAAAWLVGMALPLLAAGVYLGVNGALGAAYNATVNANMTHLNDETHGTPLRDVIEYNIYWIGQRLSTYCIAAGERWQLGAGALGFVGMLAGEAVLAVRRKQVPINLERTPFLIYTLGFLAFTLIDFDFCPDLFPLLPSLALGVGWLVWVVIKGIGASVRRTSNPHYAPPPDRGIGDDCGADHWRRGAAGCTRVQGARTDVP